MALRLRCRRCATKCCVGDVVLVEEVVVVFNTGGEDVGVLGLLDVFRTVAKPGTCRTGTGHGMD